MVNAGLVPPCLTPFRARWYGYAALARSLPLWRTLSSLQSSTHEGDMVSEDIEHIRMGQRYLEVIRFLLQRVKLRNEVSNPLPGGSPFERVFDEPQLAV